MRHLTPKVIVPVVAIILFAVCLVAFVTRGPRNSEEVAQQPTATTTPIATPQPTTSLSARPQASSSPDCVPTPTEIIAVSGKASAGPTKAQVKGFETAAAQESPKRRDLGLLPFATCDYIQATRSVFPPKGIDELDYRILGFRYEPLEIDAETGTAYLASTFSVQIYRNGKKQGTPTTASHESTWVWTGKTWLADEDTIYCSSDKEVDGCPESGTGG